MILHAFYNNKDIGDILLVRLTSNKNTTHYVTNNDVVCLYNKEELIGFNIKNASLYFLGLNSNLVKIDETFVKELNSVLSKEGLEHIEYVPQSTFVVGKIVQLEPHPDSDHMNVTQVDVGSEVLQIVCGAANAVVDLMTVVALNGAVMPSGMVIKPSKLRGVPSSGMLCSGKELNLEGDLGKKGILELDQNKYVVGEAFNI